MCVKPSPGDLNPDRCPLRPNSIYTCGMITTLRVRNGKLKI